MHVSDCPSILEANVTPEPPSTADELEAKRQLALQEGRKPKYDGTCRDKGLTSGVVRLKAPLDGATGFKDMVKGFTTFLSGFDGDLQGLFYLSLADKFIQCLRADAIREGMWGTGRGHNLTFADVVFMVGRIGLNLSFG